MHMKKYISIKNLVIIMVAMTVISCKNSSGSSNVSSATGFKINDKLGGFQYNTKFKGQEASPGMVFIEGGTFTKGRVQDDPMHDWNNSPNQQHVQSFYMDENEVTNLMYLEYLDWLKRIFPPSEANYKNIYQGAVPDTLVWRSQLGFNEEMVENYLRHPAYALYPVVGVSWIQATEFANWRTDRVNEANLEMAGYLKKDAKITDVNSGQTFNTQTYLNAPTQTYGGNTEIMQGKRNTRDSSGVYASRETGVLSPSYRLPTETEWEFGALGMSDLRDYNVYRGRKKYPWDGQYTRTGNRQTRGDQLANFKQSKGDYGGIAGWSDDGADITAPVKSYEPNDYGLYDMAGNVAEWVADVYRPIVDDEFSDFNYYRGNKFTKNAINADGTVKIIKESEVVYDTLSTGKTVARELPGEIAQVPVDENETYLRTQFSQSDNRNFRDGDLRSLRFPDDYDPNSPNQVDKSSTSTMYNSPQQKAQIVNDTLQRKWDDSDKRNSLINDRVRVFKGGSWKDRAYWLDPAQRRFFPEEMATDYIGFRCAMSRVGPKSDSKRKRRN
ncbi:MAG: gliding motility lipoprotein GldJ [Bacteroidetes bacterium]|nr:gliding motility lipoprotein GldJ [Bacteroidota bacterium]MDA0879653.1 gliding motility lipoprotein GldJ [Bacteroidota bacterium]MDA1116201.1 gliding motility lipoprotein GldJ [Bacteroidota bacterium]